MVPTLPRITLVFVGLMYAGLGVLLGPMGGLAWMNSGPGTVGPTELDAVFSVIMLVVCMGVAVGNFAIAWGLGAGKRWAWYGAMAFALLYGPSLCLPFGLAIGWPLWNDDVKKHFGV
jgi:hypothetical protein